MNSCSNSDGSDQCGTGGVWFDGYSSKLAISLGISSWENVTINGQPVAVQIPVDNITSSGSAYGAVYSFKIWASFRARCRTAPSSPATWRSPFRRTARRSR